MNERTDEHLVRASRAGRQEAYGLLVRRHIGRVYATCIGMLGSTADSEDIVQETFLKGSAQIATLRDDHRFGGWIIQIARNLCRDLVRRQSRRREILEQQQRESQPPALWAVDRPESEQDYTDLYAALAALPEKHRLPLMLFYFDGQNTQRLARELGISQAGACTRLSRARRELRALLRERAGAQ